MSVEEKFNAAVTVIRSLPKDGPYQPSQDMMLKFYGLFKQATEGPCSDPKPAFYEVVKGYKWRAWKNYGAMSKTDAMNAYVEELKKIVETMSYTENVANFVDSVGPLYDMIDVLGFIQSDKNHNTKSGVEIGAPKSEDKDKKLDNETEDELEINSKNESDNLSEDDATHPSANSKKGSESTSDEDGVTKVNGFVKVSYPVENGEVSLHKNIDGEYSGTFSKSDLAKKLLSDTESDDEYSEPFEAPEFLLQKETSRELIQQEINSASDGRVANRPKVLTRGGGDAGAAGGGSRRDNSNKGARPRDVPPDGLQPGGVFPATRGGGGGPDERQRRPPREIDNYSPHLYDDVNSQLVLILRKIHQDLQGIIVRLNSLESQAFGEHRHTCHLCQKRLVQANEKKWWPFPELSPQSTFFLLTWPLILKGLVKLFVFLRARRRQR